MPRLLVTATVLTVAAGWFGTITARRQGLNDRPVLRTALSHVSHIGEANRDTYITDGTRWSAPVRIQLHGRVHIAAGSQLTIAAGARIEAAPDAELLVDRAGRLQVVGSALQPVVFTCADGATTSGCWRGITIAGHAPINHGTLSSQSGPRGGAGGCAEAVHDQVSYGGCMPDDSSGVLQYARVQHAAYGVRLLGVGRRTRIDHLQVHASATHGLEVVGGTAAVQYVLLTASAAYGLAFRGGWTGTAQFLAILQDAASYAGGILGENAVAAGAGANAMPRSAPVLANVTVVAPAPSASNPTGTTPPAALRVARGAAGRFVNALLVEPFIAVDVDDEDTCAQVAAGTLALQQVLAAAPEAMTDPDVDVSACALHGESALIATTTIVAAPAGRQQLRAPHALALPDLRPVPGGTAARMVAAPLPPGYALLPASFVGAVDPSDGSGGSIPWYSGWTIGAAIPATPAAFSDPFSGTGPLNAKWGLFQSGQVDALSASEVAGRWQTSVHRSGTTQSAATTWFNASRGQAWWQLVEVPTAGASAFVFYNVGIAPPTDPAASLPSVNQFSFAGVIVHVEDVTEPTYEFLVAGHRGTHTATLESKTTQLGVSQVADVGANVFGDGLTRADIRVVLQSDGRVRWSYRRPGTLPWTPLDMGGTPGAAVGGGVLFGQRVRIGLIAYGFDFVLTPFIGVCDAAERVAP